MRESTGVRYEFHDLPPEPEQTRICEWLRRHGINPDDVVVPGWIERQVDLYRVAWLGLVRDENGKPRRTLATATKYVQLEGPPLPFPVMP